MVFKYTKLTLTK